MIIVVNFCYSGRYNGAEMKLESDGILIDLRPFNERDGIARVMTREHGLMGGVMRAAQVMKKNRPLVGQFGAVAWNARLDTQLGTFHWDATRNLAAPILMNARRLMFMNAAFGLITTLVPERESFPHLFDETIELLTALGDETTNASFFYLQWEMAFLRELGYALDLTACSGCGRRDNLVYLSPRTGRAVCGVCGEPYRDRLYRLPLCMDITGRFIDAACTAQGVSMPPSRRMIHD